MTTPWGTSVIFEVSSSAPNEEPVWVDLSNRILDVGQELDIGEGRQTELADVDPAVFAVQLRNRDGWLTPGNPLSPYVSWWKGGRRCRFREMVGWLGFELFDGHLEIPENLVRTQEPGATDSDIVLTVAGVDMVGWHRDGRKMISTLGEHIVHNAGPALVAYWPMSETEGPDVYPSVGGPWTLRQTNRTIGSGNAPFATRPSITYGAEGIAPADDLGSVEFDPAFAVDPLTEYDSTLMLVGDRSTPLTLDAGQVLTLVCWIRTTEAIPASGATIPIMLKNSANGDIAAQLHSSGGTGRWDAFAANDSDWAGTAEGPPITVDQPTPVAVRVGFDPNIIELWIRGEVYTSTLTVNSAAPASYDRMQLGLTYPGAINHLQVYVGDPDDWTHDDFLAQAQMGYLGLERQTTGERINTIADYAGVPASQRDIDPGASLMQRAQLAGKTAAQAWDEARDTEQGRLFAHAGRLVFHDRARIYDV